MTYRADVNTRITNTAHPFLAHAYVTQTVSLRAVGLGEREPRVNCDNKAREARRQHKAWGGA